MLILFCLMRQNCCDCADFKDGTQIAEGIVSVYIGGELVYDGKNITEARPGKCLL